VPLTEGNYLHIGLGPDTGVGLTTGAKATATIKPLPFVDFVIPFKKSIRFLSSNLILIIYSESKVVRKCATIGHSSPLKTYYS